MLLYAPFISARYLLPGRQARAGRQERRALDRARFNARLYLHNISPDLYRAAIRDRGVVIAFHSVRRQNRSDRARLISFHVIHVVAIYVREDDDLS